MFCSDNYYCLQCTLIVFSVIIVLSSTTYCMGCVCDCFCITSKILYIRVFYIFCRHVKKLTEFGSISIVLYCYMALSVENPIIDCSPSVCMSVPCIPICQKQRPTQPEIGMKVASTVDHLEVQNVKVLSVCICGWALKSP